MRMFKLSIPAKIVNNRNLSVLVILRGLLLPYFRPLRTQLLPILFHPCFHFNNPTKKNLLKIQTFFYNLDKNVKGWVNSLSVFKKIRSLMLNDKKGGNKKQ